MSSNNRLLLHSLLIFCLFCLSAAHTYLANPRPFSGTCQGCNICQIDERPLKTIYQNQNALPTWGRGETVNIKWTKNNHNGGFVRLSLLKLSDAYNGSAHNHFAFYDGCWEQGRYACTGSDCGTDKRHHAFHRYVTIPKNIPNGIYTLAFMWYGGIEYTRKFGKFANFVSCSYVRIRGGHKLSQSFQPFFSAGNTGIFKRNGKCLTSTNTPGRCLKGCPNKRAFYDIPNKFKYGRKPAPIQASEYTESKNTMPSNNNPAGHKQNGRNGASMAKQGKGHRSGISQSSTYICNHKIKICCSARCGKCEQANCGSRNGGERNCCPNYIRNYSGRNCSKNNAPCFYDK